MVPDPHYRQQHLRADQQLEYAGRPTSASPAVGYLQLHNEQQRPLVDARLTPTGRAKPLAADRRATTPPEATENRKIHAIEVKVPQLSESVSEATLVACARRPGEAVRRDENLTDIETDKVVLEVPAPADGVLPGSSRATAALR